MAKKVTKYQRTIRVDGNVYDAIKQYCKANALCITRWLEIQLKKALESNGGTTNK